MSDANEVDSWLNEKKPLVTSRDFGVDEPTAEALLKRQKNLTDEITAYKVDIVNLNNQAAVIGDISEVTFSCFHDDGNLYSTHLYFYKEYSY
jgi:hypothetical protein